MANGKTFADMKKPVRQPTPEQIAAFEETGRAARIGDPQIGSETRKAVSPDARPADPAEPAPAALPRKDVHTENREPADAESRTHADTETSTSAKPPSREHGNPPSRTSVDPTRRRRSLNTCHRFAPAELAGKKGPRASRAYVPELAARIEDDPNLTDGARRCARKLAELTYRKNREGRSLPVTVTYLAKALGRCRRTVQRYLRQLERQGYVAVEVVVSRRARMCVGLVVRLLEPLLAAHHRQRWPGRLANPGATETSLNESKVYSSRSEAYRISVEQWALRCMDGVFRAFMATDPLAKLPKIVIA